MLQTDHLEFTDRKSLQLKRISDQTEPTKASKKPLTEQSISRPKGNARDSNKSAIFRQTKTRQRNLTTPSVKCITSNRSGETPTDRGKTKIHALRN